MIRKGLYMRCILSKMNRGASCYCELFISGASGICLPAAPLHVLAAFHFVFSMSKTSQGEWDMSIVAEIIFHLKISFTLKRQGWSRQGRRKEEHFQNLSLVKISDIAVSIFTFTPPSFPLLLSLSSYVYLISPTKPITAMFPQPLQSHSASYWPFTKLPYNAHNH